MGWQSNKNERQENNKTVQQNAAALRVHPSFSEFEHPKKNFLNLVESLWPCEEGFSIQPNAFTRIDLHFCENIYLRYTVWLNMC